MSDNYMINPDLEFIKEIQARGGDSLKKCFQCATCSVACPISPDKKPFPRKEMISASWGLKDKLVGNGDIWLCHNCGDCSTLCPRGAKPGDVLAAIRSYAISEYAAPKAVGKLISDPKKIPVLFAIPTIIFLVVGLITGLLDFTPELNEHGQIAHHLFFSSWLVDMLFVPLAIWVVAVFAMGLKRFIGDIHKNALEDGKTDKKEIEAKGFIEALIRVIPKIITHKQFSQCGENSGRATPHMMVLFSFVGLFIVTSIFFVVLYGFGIHGPYAQFNPVKVLANISGIALVIGGLLLLKTRMDKTDEVSTYQDWYLIGLVLGLGVTGMLTELTRLSGMAELTYLLYFIHLTFVFNLFFFLPFSKLAHLVYRTVAMTYNEYSGREVSNT
ncbi:MAG: heterodisulfide reductase [Deltaproteobacteria bacterium]|nr:heterodisulfide reductase [Deltaproteobacteria bacterium]